MMYWSVIIITSILIITCGGIELHTDHTKLNINVEKSWLTTAEFTKYLSLSLNVSRCTNVFLNGASETTNEHFKNFVRIYPNPYVVGDPVKKCTGYLVISTTATGLSVNMFFAYPDVLIENPMSEILIIVDQTINASCKLLNPKMYNNANVKIMSPNSRWYLSKKYLTPRVFKEVHSFKDLEYDTGIANLEGRELITDLYNDPPHVYMDTNKAANGVNVKSSINSRKPKFDGISLQIFNMIVERLNATYKFKNLVNSRRYAKPAGYPLFRDIVTQMNSKQVDIILSLKSLNTWDTMFKYLMIPFGKNYVHFLVPRPKLRTNFWAPVTPFSSIVWISIIIMLITQSLFVYTKARLFPTRVSKKFESFAITWIELMGRLLNTTAPKIIPGFKITFQLWSVASILLMTAYSSNLASKLTSPSYEKRIDTPKDFIEANLTWENNGHDPEFNFYFAETNPDLKQIKWKFVNRISDSERREKILEGNYAIIGKVIGNVFFPDHCVYAADLKGYRLMKQAMFSSYVTFAVQPWLQDSSNKIILLLSDYGFVDYHVRHVIHRHTVSALREVLIEREDKYEGPRVLSLKPLEMCFSFLILGLLLSTIVFILEVVSFTGRQKSVLKVFMDIKKNREMSNFREKKKNRMFRLFKLNR